MNIVKSVDFEISVRGGIIGLKNIEEFKSLLLKTTDDDDRIGFIRKDFFHETPYGIEGRENDYVEFKDRISKNFGISFHGIFIGGAGKFGFSYVKNTLFSYDSDIDVVLVNEALFDYYYEKICDYQYQMDNYHKLISLEEKKEYADFLRYLIKGWMRPDLLPVSFKVDFLKNEWFDFFKSVSYNKSEVGNYKVAGGLYKNYKYLEKYYSININSFYKKLKLERGEYNG